MNIFFSEKKKMNGHHIEYLLLLYMMKIINFISHQKNIF